MNRRSFLGSILAACAAPAIVRADSLMRIVPVETLVIPANEYVMMIERITKEQLMRIYSRQRADEAFDIYVERIALTPKSPYCMVWPLA